MIPTWTCPATAAERLGNVQSPVASPVVRAVSGTQYQHKSINRGFEVTPLVHARAAIVKVNNNTDWLRVMVTTSREVTPPWNYCQ